MIQKSLLITVLALGSAAWAAGDFPPGGMRGGPQLSNTQKTCLETKMGKPGDEGSRPSREKMESVFKECGVTPPSSGIPRLPSRTNQNPGDTQKTSATKIDPSAVISELKPLRGENNDYLRLDGKIPKACKEKISIRMTCADEDKVSFAISELTQDAFACLKDNQKKCQAKNSSAECISFDELSKDRQLQGKFTSKLELKTAKSECSKIKIQSAKVTILKNYFDPSLAKTEAGKCTECQSQSGQFEKLQAQVQALKNVVDKQNETLSKMPDLSKGPPGGRDDLERKFAGGRRPPRDEDMDENFDEDMPKRPRREAGGDRGMMGGMNMGRANGGMNAMGMGGMSSMMGGYGGGMNMMGMGGMSSMMGGYGGGMKMMGLGGMSSMMGGYGGGIGGMSPYSSYDSTNIMPMGWVGRLHNRSSYMGYSGGS
ncbi:MAG: hypothetical protein IPK68_14670 [Bdellovibrionales bacterium]|nr:hypothetical protein [Bdellovibrionales bacterium]